tara:strand:- start:18191 stop:18835 length:645 start_codon:yes stop_codon:yes gene_type:complete
MMADNPCKQPVHEALYRPTLLDTLTKEGRLDQDAPFSIKTPAKVQLPKKERSPVAKFNPLSALSKVSVPKNTRSMALRTRLRVLYDTIPPLEPEKVPDCSSCSGACCRIFLVFLTQEEYESGFYGDAAVRVTEESARQLTQSYPALAAAIKHSSTGAVYLLEGPEGVVCPFLSETNSCGIYEDRPLVCRTYTCVDDLRVTEEMKKVNYVTRSFV